MAVLNYMILSHTRDEFPHVQRKNIRGANRKRNRRQTRRLVKRWDERQWRRDMDQD